MRGDEESDALPAEIEQQIPQLAPGHRIDAGSRFVEINDLGLVQHGAAQRQPLLPAARKLAGQAMPVRLQAVAIYGLFDLASAGLGIEAVNLRVEAQILQNRKIVIEGKFLAHVADALAHRVGIGADVNAIHPGAAAGQRQNAAQHLDDRGLAAAVGAEEAEDFARLDAQAHAIHGSDLAEFADHVFRDDGAHDFFSGTNCTSA